MISFVQRIATSRFGRATSLNLRSFDFMLCSFMLMWMGFYWYHLPFLLSIFLCSCLYRRDYTYSSLHLIIYQVHIHHPFQESYTMASGRVQPATLSSWLDPQHMAVQSSPTPSANKPRLHHRSFLLSIGTTPFPSNTFASLEPPNLPLLYIHPRPVLRVQFAPMR